jgi:hypothetical protein
METPATSSRAELIRTPVDKRSIDFSAVACADVAEAAENNAN